MSRFTRIEIWLGRIFLGLLSVAATFFIVEIGFRAFGASRFSDDLLQISDYTHSPRPYLMFTGNPGKHDYNALGYKGPLPDMPKPKDETRVLMFGGSVVHNDEWFGGGPSLPSRLEKVLQAKTSQNVRFYNFGVVSSVSRQDVIRLLIDGLGFNPDLVLFYGAGNDLIGYYDPRPNYPHRFFLYESNPIMTLNVADYQWLPALAMGSAFVRHFLLETLTAKIFRSPALVRSGRPLNPTELLRLRTKAYIENIRLAGEICRAYGIGFVNALQPLNPLKPKPTAGEMNAHLGPRELLSAYDEIRSSLAGPSFVDVSRVFDSESATVFRDSIHVNSHGNDMITEDLSQKLLPKIQEAVAHPAPAFPHPPETEYLLDWQ